MRVVRGLLHLCSTVCYSGAILCGALSIFLLMEGAALASANNDACPNLRACAVTIHSSGVRQCTNGGAACGTTPGGRTCTCGTVLGWDMMGDCWCT